jgi:hypothetical protein
MTKMAKAFSNKNFVVITDVAKYLRVSIQIQTRVGQPAEVQGVRGRPVNDSAYGNNPALPCTLPLPILSFVFSSRL